MATLRLQWFRLADAQRDYAQQVARGGVYIAAAPPADVRYGAKIAVALVTLDGRAHRYEGEVLAATPGAGMAVTVPADVSAALAACLRGPDAADRDPVHDWWDGRAEAPKPSDGPRAYDTLSQPEKMRLALHGDRDDRAAVLRDKNRALHVHVLKNPHLSVEEVIAIAKNPQTGAELLEFIASRSEWATRATVAEALARNPKTPQEVAVRALQHVATEPLRQMAKGQGAPPHVVQAARKRVLG
jgi:hypothetical protein